MLCTYCTTGRFTIKASPAFLLHKTKFNFKLFLAIVLWYIMKVFANFQNKILILRSLWFCKNENFAPRGRNCRFFGIYFLKIYLIDRNVYVETSDKSLHPTEGHWPGPSILWRSRHIWRRPLMRVLQSCDGPCSLWVCSIFSGHFTNQLSASDAELDNSELFFAGLGIRSSVFWANCSFFAKKLAKERFAQKKRPIPSFAHFWWATWAICSWLLFAHQKWIAHFLNKKPI